LGIQIIGLLAYSFWALSLSFVFFYFLKLNERLRIDPLFEILGMDYMGEKNMKNIKKK
jgi:ammonia channel protein AmtB